MNLERVDLNLLIYLDVLLREKNVTRAAEQLGVTQPAMSNILRRLRNLFNDPLLIRSSEGMTPTERALELQPRIRDALSDLSMILEPRTEFRPYTSNRVFRIMTSDYAEATLVPRLVKALRSEAPNVVLDFLTPSDVSYRDMEQGKVDLYGILFDTDKTLIKSESEPTLKEVAQLLQDDSALKLSIIGHTDNVGTKEYNDKLSQGRAQAVVGWLMLNGVDMTRLKPLGRGFDEPVAPNDTEEGRAKNRRVELRKAV